MVDYFFLDNYHSFHLFLKYSIFCFQTLSDINLSHAVSLGNVGISAVSFIIYLGEGWGQISVVILCLTELSTANNFSITRLEVWCIVIV